MKRIRRNHINKKKILYLSIIICVAVFMSVGFSILSQRIEIVGNTNLYASEKYLWHKITNDYGVGTTNGFVANEYENNKYSYVYSSTDTNVGNYITFNNETWRILSIENDNAIKIINLNYSAPANNKVYDTNGNRTTASTYCTNLEHGCNAWASKSVLTNDTINGNVENDSSINTYLNNVYYNSLSETAKNQITDHNFNVGSVESGKTTAEVIAQEIDQTWIGKVGLLTISDIMYASGSSFELGTSTTMTASWLTNSTDRILTMSMLKNNNYQIWTYGPGNSYTTQDSNVINFSENQVNVIYPVVYLKSTAEYNSGKGT